VAEAIDGSNRSQGREEPAPTPGLKDGHGCDHQGEEARVQNQKCPSGNAPPDDPADPVVEPLASECLLKDMEKIRCRIEPNPAFHQQLVEALLGAKPGMCSAAPSLHASPAIEIVVSDLRDQIELHFDTHPGEYPSRQRVQVDRGLVDHISADRVGNG
jgi:hypothetical protein